MSRIGRRKLLHAGGVALSMGFSGCTSLTSVGGSPTSEAPSETAPTSLTHSTTTTTSATSNSVSCTSENAPLRTPTEDDIGVSFKPQTGGTATQTRERVVFENDSTARLDLRGHAVMYDSGQTYTFNDLVLPPASGVLVVSQGTGDGTLDACPPDFIRDARFETRVLSDGYSKVELVAPNGTTVIEAEYNEA